MLKFTADYELVNIFSQKSYAIANGVKEVHGKMVIETILRPLVDLQTASKRSNSYRDISYAMLLALLKLSVCVCGVCALVRTDIWGHFCVFNRISVSHMR